MSVKCLICGIEKKCSIVEHLKYEHKMSSKIYKEKFPNSIVKSKEMSEIISQLYSEGKIKNEKNKYKTGTFKSKNGEEFIYSSSYELDSMIFFDLNETIVKWTNKHGIRIKYYFNNLSRNYVPDFLVELSDGSTYIIEMKGWETDEVKVKEYYTKKIYPNYKIFYSVNDLKKFIYENK